MKTRFYTGTVVLLFFLMSMLPAQALETLNGHVLWIEASYMPGAFKIKLDGGNATCPANRALTWKKDVPENVKSVYATVLAALVSGKKIDFLINDSDTECMGQYLYIIGGN